MDLTRFDGSGLCEQTWPESAELRSWARTAPGQLVILAGDRSRIGECVVNE